MTLKFISLLPSLKTPKHSRSPHTHSWVTIFFKIFFLHFERPSTKWRLPTSNPLNPTIDGQIHNSSVYFPSSFVETIINILRLNTHVIKYMVTLTFSFCTNPFFLSGAYCRLKQHFVASGFDFLNFKWLKIWKTFF